MSRLLAVFIAAFASLPAQASDRDVVRQRLAAHLFGQPVGDVRLTLTTGADSTTLTYRSELRVVRDKERVHQTAELEVSYSDHLLRSHARRCTSASPGAQPTCAPEVTLENRPQLPSLAAELLLARRLPGQHCLDVVDEESGATGTACAEVRYETSGNRMLIGTKLGAPFLARVNARGMLVYLELPDHGARFSAIEEGALALSDADLFADSVPSSGDIAAGLRRGTLRLKLTAPAEALELLSRVQAPAQRTLKRDGTTALVETRQARIPTSPRDRRIIDAAALLVAQARGTHTDCQTATEWFLAQARKRGWDAKQAVGLAWVDNRFAFHSWVLIKTESGSVPIDPLLAQVPADAGHVQLAAPGESAGSLLVAFRRGLSVEAVEK